MKVLNFLKLLIPKTHNRIPVTLIFFAGLLLAPITCLDILQAISIVSKEQIVIHIECGEYKFGGAFVLIIFALIYHYLITGRMEKIELEKRTDCLSLIQARTDMALALAKENDTPLDATTVINEIQKSWKEEE